MKNLLLVMCFCMLLKSSFSQDNSIRLIVRGDDMGFTHSGNEALIKSYKEGIETAVEVIVPSPWFPEAVKLLKENPGLDVGVHLTLTSEWENIKWRPLTECLSLKDSNGYFFPMVNSTKYYPGQAILDHQWKIEDVEKEFRAQIEMGLRNIPGISHLSAHMNCTSIGEDVKLLVTRLAKEYKIPFDPESNEYKKVYYNGFSRTTEEKVQSFIVMLDKLEGGKTYLFLDHPGIDGEELKAAYHANYTYMHEDRQGVTDLFTNKKVKEYIRQKGIKLISFRDLALLPKS